MGILQTLAGLEHGAIVSLGDVRLRVGESDRDAAQLLIKLLAGVGDEPVTQGHVEGILLSNWLSAVLGAQGAGAENPLIAPRAAALWDALWWFRLMSYIHAADSAAPGATP